MQGTHPYTMGRRQVSLMTVERMATLKVASEAVPPAEAGSAASTAPAWLPAARAQKPNPEPASGSTCSPNP